VSVKANTQPLESNTVERRLLQNHVQKSHSRLGTTSPARPSGNATTQALDIARTNDHGPEEAEIPTGEDNSRGSAVLRQDDSGHSWVGFWMRGMGGGWLEGEWSMELAKRKQAHGDETKTTTPASFTILHDC